jgi:hypothetical protein
MRVISIRTGIYVSRRGDFGYKTYYLRFIYKGYIFIYNANPCAGR